MQIQGSFVSTSSVQPSARSRPSQSAPPAEDRGTAPEARTSATPPATESARPLESGPVDGFRQALEEVFRSRVAPGREVEVEEDDHGRERRDEDPMRDGLRTVRKAVRSELKSLVRGLEQRGEVEGEDEHNPETRELRDEVKDIGKAFDRALKDLEHGVSEDDGSTSPGAVLDSLESSFEDLFARLRTALGGAGEAEESGGARPTDTSTPEVARGADAATRVVGTAGTQDGAAPTVVEPTPAELEPVPVAGEERGLDSGTVANERPDFGAGLRDRLASILGGLESAFREISAGLAPMEVEGVEAQDDDDHDDAVGARAESTPAGTSFDFAISAYTSVTFEFSMEVSGSRLDASV